MLRCAVSGDADAQLVDVAGIVDHELPQLPAERRLVLKAPATAATATAIVTSLANEPPQWYALSSDTKYVTLTFGGNDLGFKDVLTQCIYGKYGPKVVYGKSGCSNETSLTTAVANRLKALAGTGTAFTPSGIQIHSIASILQRIHQLAPSAKIYVADYPLLFGTNFKHDCGVGTAVASNVPVVGTATIALKVSKADAAWLDSVGTSIANVMNTTATANGATFVDANTKFSSHRFCDTSDLWFEPFSGTADYNTKQLTYYPPRGFSPDIGRSAVRV